MLVSVVKVDRRIRWHYTTTIPRLRIGARLTRYRNCKFHNFARTISRHADGISRYCVPPSAFTRESVTQLDTTVKSTMTETCSAVLRSRRNCSSDGAERTDDDMIAAATDVNTEAVVDIIIINITVANTLTYVVTDIQALQKRRLRWQLWTLSFQTTELLPSIHSNDLDRLPSARMKPRLHVGRRHRSKATVTCRRHDRPVDYHIRTQRSVAWQRQLHAELRCSHKTFLQCPLSCLQCFDAVGWAAGRASGM